MKKIISTALVFGVSLAAGLVVATVITCIAWGIHIEGRAFRRNDPGSMWWTNIEAHRNAGDALSAGWSWEAIARIRTVYEVAFFAIWLSFPAATFYILRKLNSPDHSSPPGATEKGRTA